MQLLTAQELLDKLRTGDETVTIEAKRAEQVGFSVLETVSAMSNEPGMGGGYIICGVALRDDALMLDYEVVGVPNPNKLQSDLVARCNDALNNAVRPVVQVEPCEGKVVVVIFVPEVPPALKPIYIKSKGLPAGAFRRIGSADQHCTDDDLNYFHELRDHKTFDETPVPETTTEDVEPLALAEYRRARSENKPDAAELGLSDSDLLFALGATTRHEGSVCLTIAGLMLFGKQAALRRHFPLTRVDYIIVEGREWVPNPDARYQTVEEWECLLLLIPRLVSRVVSDIPQAFSLSENGIHRREAPRIPRTVIREAVVNALMHRSYRKRETVQIIRYANRIEIRNPGHSLKSEEHLGEPGSVARNEKIAATIHEAGIAETKGTGIRAMRDDMRAVSLAVPYFESNRESDTFTATLLFHHFLDDKDVSWLGEFKDCGLTSDEARLLIVVRETGAINNGFYRNLSGLDTLAASRSLLRLRDLKLLAQKGKSSATYYVPGQRFTASLAWNQPNPPDSGLSEGLNPPDSGLSEGLRALPPYSELPEALRLQVDALGKRATPDEVMRVILALCAWRELKAQEIALIMGRTVQHLLENYLSPAIKQGSLVYTYPDNAAHPQQAYRIAMQQT